jgi:hypothetical protein
MTGVTPKALESRPELASRLGYYYQAYNRLARSRDVSMGGPLPLKVSEILAYCTLFEIRQVEERGRLFDHITNLDDTYLDYLAKKNKASDAKPKQ